MKTKKTNRRNNESVSYTHLDVYKRQPVYSQIMSNDEYSGLATTSAVSYTHLDVYKRQPVYSQIMSNDEYSGLATTSAVSYTHLDVYKRQAPICSLKKKLKPICQHSM
ncbi:hypothetical protein [Erwinia amylovora]